MAVSPLVFASLNPLNPGNGTETFLTIAGITKTIASLNPLNPGNGTETIANGVDLQSARSQVSTH